MSQLSLCFLFLYVPVVFFDSLRPSQQFFSHARTGLSACAFESIPKAVRSSVLLKDSTQ